MKHLIMTKPALDMQEEASDEVEAEVSPDNYESALGKALAYWRSGRSIPMTIAVELMAEGYDVGALEAFYLEV